MANCLVTKLKGVVDNDNLRKLGEIIFPAVRSDFPGNGMEVFFTSSASLGSPNLILEDLDGNFYGKNYSVAEGNGISEIVPAGHRLKLRSKYDLGQWLIGFYNLPYGYEAILSLKDFQYSQKLTSLTGTNLFWDIDDKVMPLENLNDFQSIYGQGDMTVANLARFIPNAKSIKFSSNYGHLRGEIKDFGPMINLTLMQLGECNVLSGSVEDFVRAQISHERTTASIETLYWKYTQCTFNGERVSQNVDTTTLSWEINGSDSSKVDITYVGVTITVPISVV